MELPAERQDDSTTNSAEPIEAPPDSRSDPSIPRPGIRELIAEHYAAVYRFGWRMSGTAHDAEDLVQQTFLDAHRKLDQLREPAKARAWLFMIVRNLYRRRLRDQKPERQFRLESVAEPAVPTDADPLDSEGLQHALDGLPEEFRAVLVLYYFRELSYREIAEHLDMPVGTVMSRLSRGKQHLRQRLKPEDV